MRMDPGLCEEYIFKKSFLSFQLCGGGSAATAVACSCKETDISFTVVNLLEWEV